MKKSFVMALGAVLALVPLCPADQNLSSVPSDSGRWSSREDAKPVLTMQEASFAGVPVIGRDSLRNPLLVSQNTVDLSNGPRLDDPVPASQYGPAMVRTASPLSLPNTRSTPTGPELLAAASFPPRTLRN